MTDAALLELYQAVWRDTSGDELAVARALFEAGRLTRPSRRKRHHIPSARTVPEKRLALYEAAVPFLQRRWAHLLEQAATKHRTTVVKMLAGVRPGRPLSPAIDEACKLLRDQAELAYEQIASVLELSGGATVQRAIRRAGARPATLRRRAA